MYISVLVAYCYPKTVFWLLTPCINYSPYINNSWLHIFFHKIVLRDMIENSWKSFAIYKGRLDINTRHHCSCNVSTISIRFAILQAIVFLWNKYMRQWYLWFVQFWLVLSLWVPWTLAEDASIKVTGSMMDHIIMM